MIITPVGPEMYLPPRIFDKAVSKVDIRTRIKAPLKLEKETFKTPVNPKAPKTSFIIGAIMKFHYFTKQDLDNKKIELERDKGNVTPASRQTEEEEEDSDEEEEDE